MTRYRDFNKDLKPSIPFIFLVDGSGQRTASTSGSFLIWDTILMKSSHFHYEPSTDRIILNTNSSGIYKIMFEVSVQEQSAANESYWWLYKNGEKIEESKSICKSNDSNDAVHVAIFYYIFLEKDDYIQVEGEGDGGNCVTMANTSRISIEFIPMKGWDNSSGGRLEYKGGISR